MEPWYPAGPAMDTLVYMMYVDENAELTGLVNGEIDLTDWALTPTLFSSMTTNPNFYVTSPISDNGYFELQFNLAANFWGCQLNFGNSACGREIRQGIAHSLDKVKFTSLQAAIAGISVPIDNPVPPSVDLTLPNPCSWDAAHVQTGSNCVVGEGGATGGVAYHLAPAVACGVAAPGTCTSTPTRLWTPGYGTLDFCAAADHFIAAGLASGKVGSAGSTTTDSCKLTGISPAVTAFPVNVFIMSDSNPRLQAGSSVEEFICALLGGGFTSAGCSGLTVTFGPITAFPGFITSPTAVEQDWSMYTAYINDIPTFDRSLYFDYASQFVSGIPSIKQSGGGHCSNNAVPSYTAANYMYLCSQTYDTLITQAEYAPCLAASGDPVNGQVTPTFANCPATTQLSSTSASYQAQDLFGQNAFTIPWFSQTSQFAYRSNWQRVVLHQGDGFTPPGNIPGDLNAWSPTPVLAGSIRQGFKSPFQSLSPFAARSQWDLGIMGNIWDKPSYANPASPQLTLNGMALDTSILAVNQVTYVPPPGTVNIVRYTLRNDIFWQTGQKVTAWDLAFSYVSLRATGVFNGGGLAAMTGVKVLSPLVVDIDLNGLGPYTRQSISTYVFPGRFWSSCGASAWAAGASNANFGMADAALTPCIGPNVTPSGVVLASASAVDSSKILPAFDPGASGILVGSGPWQCKSGTGVVGSGCYCLPNCPPGPGLDTVTLQRYGFGFAPGASLNTYFRSSGNLALWAWSGNTGNFNADFLNFGVVSLCFGVSPVPPSCTHWSMGIGNPSGSSGSPAPIGLTQIGILQRFVGVNWVSPYNWVSSPPQGIAAFPPVLHEGSVTLNPASLVGCASPFSSGGGYDC